MSNKSHYYYSDDMCKIKFTLQVDGLICLFSWRSVFIVGRELIYRNGMILYRKIIQAKIVINNDD